MDKQVEDGQITGRLGVWWDSWVVRWMSAQVDGWVCRQVDERTGRQTDEWVDEWTGG